MKEIKLTQGKATLVDDKDFQWLSDFNLCAHKRRNTFYVVRRNKQKKVIYMHREIMEKHLGRKLEPWEHIDHIDHDGLNNRIDNLRICSRSQNYMNQQKRENCSSEYKGVSWNKREQQWRSYIAINGKEKHLGYFNLEKEAAHHYDFFAIQYFKEFSNLNFPEFDYGGFETKPLREKTSKFKGVSWHKRYKKWQVSISFQGKRIYLGRFEKEKDAVEVYNKKHKELLEV